LIFQDGNPAQLFICFSFVPGTMVYTIEQGGRSW
jgi:hypothetical protein